MLNMLISATLLMAAAGSAPPAATLQSIDYAARAGAWQIGPIIRGRNYSVGMPLQPTQSRRGWFLDFPYPDARAGHVHYVTFNHGPLTGKTRIVMRYRIDAAPGVRFVPQETPELPGTISLVFQRRGDNWNARGRFEHYRWYAPAASVTEIRPGEHEMSVRLDDPEWISVQGRLAASFPEAFRDAIDDAERVGIVLGSRQARGHGDYATGPARLTVLSFHVL